ncbi:TIGR02646 family protein [Salmonella enterica]|uniref:TIGR02646 family protein n=8 Tax=Enterobacteriaceae TaxID=543 RepID=A0A608CTB1_SALET|nr:MULTISPECIES: retron Ec78 anti-phage system effector HNH endonuclease PtuB [Enterobacteriaceae]EAY3106252.1 TIGR02646 family protein [Salmonella enterica subsp. enterica serovar Typhimurium]EDV1334731.1 TIGR02646 family protein [Salmonella enterica subsp. salamae]EEY4454159.1 TIGR02646 family protein [Escherichia coli O130]EFA4163279.1 TIGR02646 family protein [Escherichia coli O70:H25]EFA4198664.1 TIGR02646 family protein [Escherichia coli O132]EGQ0571163.1 TIGR02646 family protein [Salmo
MKYLSRQMPGPSVLNKFDYRRDDWNSLSSNDKKEIWEEIIKMQGKLCAYCEKKIEHHKSGGKNKVERHIEHFYRKSYYKNLTFEWSNLFGSCGEPQRCGFYKDKQKYNDDDLIKADRQNPDVFFHFLENGDVHIREGLNEKEHKMAEVTLRVFNLNPSSGGVKAERRRAIELSMTLIKELVGCASQLIESGCEIEDVRSMVFDEFKKNVKDRCFTTAIKHVFENRMP